MTQDSHAKSPQKPSRIFISHSSEDQEFSDLVVKCLQNPAMAGWIDSEQIGTGEDILVAMGEGLRSMDILVVLISQAALESSMVAFEVNHAIWQEVREKRVIVLPFIIDGSRIDAVRDNARLWHLAQRHLTSISQNQAGAQTVVDSVRRSLEKRFSFMQAQSAAPSDWRLETILERTLRSVPIGDWKTATEFAVKILETTTDSGDNEIFQKLITALFQIKGDDDLLWGAIQIIESVASLAPSLIDHSLMARLANHSDFTIRTVAANLCMDFAQFAPDRVPLDIAFRLSKYDEDWYVMAPALAALKALIRPLPGILAFFYTGLHDKDPQAREHFAGALLDVSKHDPDLLDPSDVEREIALLWRVGDEWSAKTMTQVWLNAMKSERKAAYQYGI